MTGLSRTLLVSVLALATVGDLQAGTRGHIQDDAGLFSDETLARANLQLFEVAEKTRTAFWLRTVKKLPDDVLTELGKIKKSPEQNAFLKDFARETAIKDGMTGVFVLVVVGDGPRERKILVVETNTGVNRVMTDTELHSIYTVLDTKLSRMPNDSLLNVVDRVEDTLLRRSAGSSISWPMLGAALAGLVGLWLLLRAVRMRAAQRSGETAARRPTHVGGLFGGLFGVVAGHWIYDTLFEQEKSPAAEVAPGQNPLDAPLELKQSESADAR